MAIDQRLLPVILFLFSAAPLASLYALVGWAVWGSDGHSFSHVAHSSDPNSPMSMVLQNANATLEELWSAIFQERLAMATGVASSSTTTHHADTAFIMASGGIPHIRMKHWAIVAPWLIAVILGFVVPCVLSINSRIQRQRRRRHRSGGRSNDIYDDNEWSARFDLKNRRKRKLKRIINSLQDFKKVLIKDDFLDDKSCPSQTDEDKEYKDENMVVADDSSNQEEEEEGTKLVMLPKPGYRLVDLLSIHGDDKTNHCRAVENLCTICLTQYIPGDSVVWSINPRCNHVFHETCITSWLARKRKHPLCPCCRQPFLTAQQEMAIS